MQIAKSKKTILVFLAFILGIFLASFFQFPTPKGYFPFYIILGIIFVFGLMVVAFWQDKIVQISAFLGIILFVAIAYYFWFYKVNFPENMPFGQQISIEAQVAAEPDIRDDQQRLTLTTKFAGKTVKILAILPRFPEYKYGDKIAVTGLLQRPKKSADFDYEQYLRRYQIYGIIFKPEQVQLVNTNSGNQIYKLIFQFKNYFLKTINSILPEPLASFLAGLLVGVRRSIPSDLISALNATGTTHIIAISGYNISILIKIFYDWLKNFSLRLAFWATLVFIFLFIILTGAQASVIRAAIMGSMFLLARQVGRKEYPTIAVLFCALVMIVQNPFILKADIGFQLSFAAVMGLIYLQPILERWFSSWCYWKKTPLILRESLTATLAAQIFTLPLLISYFGRISAIAPVANILILPFIPFAMGVGFVASMAGLVWLALGKILGWLAWLILRYMTIVVENLAKLPFASFEISKWNFIWVSLYYLILTTFLFWYSKYQKKLKSPP